MRVGRSGTAPDADIKAIKKGEDRRLFKETMQKANPRYVLKNYMLQEAIEKAQDGDFSLVNELLHVAQNPFDEHPELTRYTKATPHQFKALKLSCSS